MPDGKRAVEEDQYGAELLVRTTTDGDMNNAGLAGAGLAYAGLAYMEGFPHPASN